MSTFRPNFEALKYFSDYDFVRKRSKNLLFIFFTSVKKVGLSVNFQKLNLKTAFLRPGI